MMKRNVTRVFLLEVAVLAVLATAGIVRVASAEKSKNCTNLPSGAEENFTCEIAQQNLCGPLNGGYCSHWNGHCDSGVCSPEPCGILPNCW